MQRTPRQCTLRNNGGDSSGGPMSSAKQDRPFNHPYLRQESSLTVCNLNKALNDMKKTMKVFKGLREAHNLGDEHFEELENNYLQLKAAAQSGKTRKDIFLMKKTTASLEIMLFDLKKGNKQFERRYKKLIAQAKAAKEGRAVEEVVEDNVDDEEDGDDDDDYEAEQGEEGEEDELDEEELYD